jgi:hypothetical protein
LHLRLKNWIVFQSRREEFFEIWFSPRLFAIRKNMGVTLRVQKFDVKKAMKLTEIFATCPNIFTLEMMQKIPEN